MSVPQGNGGPSDREVGARGQSLSQWLRRTGAGRGAAWAVILALVLVVIFFFVGLVSLTTDDSAQDVSAEPGTAVSGGAAAQSPGVGAVEGEGLQRWLLSGAVSDYFTVEVSPEGSGSVRVLEDATAVGTYEWSGDALTIQFTRQWTPEGPPTKKGDATFDDPWRFDCVLSEGRTTMACECTSTPWEYSPGPGGTEGTLTIGTPTVREDPITGTLQE